MKVQLSLKATKLENVAGRFKGTSDPFAVVTVLSDDNSAKPTIVGKTEVIKNNLNPDWTKSFILDYEMGKPTNIIVKVFDEVSKGDNISMGSVVFEVGSILGAKGNTKAKKMKKSTGTVYARVEKPVGSGTLQLKMSGVKLTNTEGFLRKSDPFYEFKRKDYGPKGTEWNVVHRSEAVKNNLSPDWKTANIDLGVLSDDDFDKPLMLTIFDHESDGNHVVMGSIETSVNKLVEAKGRPYGLTLKKAGNSTGSLVIHKATITGVEEAPSLTAAMSDVQVTPSAPAFIPTPSAPPMPVKPNFIDYLNGGCEISLCCAIDFTGSNGDPRKPGTLHYLDPSGATKNDYEKAISAIGGVLAQYDSDKKFPVWGFGAKYNGSIYHLFQCGSVAEVDGIPGVLNAYHQTFKSGLVMSGPTVFTEVINTAAAFAQSGHDKALKEGKQNYSILLILTDGSVSDVRATVDCLKSVQNSPLSIVIVGIGNEDFSTMKFLDDGGATEIDIAQFVEFNAHKHDANSLTSATLNEIPDQLVSFFTRNNMMPLPPVKVTEEEIVVEPMEEEIDLSIDFPAGGDKEIVVSGDPGCNFVPVKPY